MRVRMEHDHAAHDVTSKGDGQGLLGALGALVALGLLYWFPVLSWFSRGGTNADELAGVMPGDALNVDPTQTATQAVTVNAAPGDIWPWLVQMGYRRGGLYSYDWLDRVFGCLDRPSASRFIPELQTLAVGDTILLGPREELAVASMEVDRSLVLSYKAHGMEWVWQFGLYPVDSRRTRLVTRGTEHVPNTPVAWLGMRIMEPAAFIMTRRMLLGLKSRAEALRRSRV